jgi:hypothetical protein
MGTTAIATQKHWVAYASLNMNRSLILMVIKDVFLLLPALEMSH